jgi:tRNA threonylcarbamoyladenosine biosynthesis protein TsaE
MKIIVNSLAELPAVATRIISAYPAKIIAFYGEMGAGKTTFIKVLCACLGVKSNEICSPTYSIVNEYEASGKQCVYHFDFYRINSEQEAFDLGYEEYFYSDAYCFIEWPEKIENLLPANLLKIHIETDSNKRIFTIEESNS